KHWSLIPAFLTAQLEITSKMLPVMAAVRFQHQIYVTLNCSSSSGWKYYWYRDGKSYEALTNGQISVSEGGLYSCIGGRGEPFKCNFQQCTTSDGICTFFPVKPTVTLQPSWPQIYSGETVTVRCEIQGSEGTQWTYEWRRDQVNISETSNEYRIITVTESDSGGYSCRGRRDYLLTEWSDTITLTVSCKLEMFHPHYLFHQNQ
uniref:Ig-like domain-containing protein n=1 Tax=Oreochromis aureus TaxID=47969 RepID=A0A668SYK5_OREAU